MTDSLNLLKGTLDLLVLQALSCGTNHGYGIVRWLEEGSSGALDVTDSALYQALRRLHARKQVQAEWRLSETGRRARYYRLTAAGEARLRRETSYFQRYTATVSDLLAIEAT